VSHQVGDPALEHPMDHVDRLTQELGLAMHGNLGLPFPRARC
jgi:hypothetical protein